MPTIGVAISAGTKAEFESVARARGTTSSRLGASIIEDFLKRESSNTPSLLPVATRSLATAATVAIEVSGARTKQVHVRLEPYYYAELGRLVNSD